MSMLLQSGVTQETATHNLGQETRGDTWQQPPLPHVTWAAGAGPGRLLPASAWWSESLSAPYTTLPSGWPGQQRGVTASAVL